METFRLNKEKKEKLDIILNVWQELSHSIGPGTVRRLSTLDENNMSQWNLTNLACSPFVWQREQVHCVDQLWQMQTKRWEIESPTWFFEDLGLWGLEIYPCRRKARNEERISDHGLSPEKSNIVPQ